MLLPIPISTLLPLLPTSDKEHHLLEFSYSKICLSILLNLIILNEYFFLDNTIIHVNIKIEIHYNTCILLNLNISSFTIIFNLLLIQDPKIMVFIGILHYKNILGSIACYNRT